MFSYLKKQIEKCNEKIVLYAKQFVRDYLCDDEDPETYGLKESVELAEILSKDDKRTPEECILIFWLNARNCFSQKLLQIS